MSNSIAPGSSANVNVRVTALTTNPNVPVQYKTIILKKNLVNGVNTLTQAMVNQANIKYVIKYDYVLGEDITVPENCILEFDGGSLSNGTIIGNNTKIKASCSKIFNNVICTGSYKNAVTYFSWFSHSNANNTEELKSLFVLSEGSIFTDVYIEEGLFYVDGYDEQNESAAVCHLPDNSYIHNLATFKVLGTSHDTSRPFYIAGRKNITLEGGRIIGCMDDYEVHPDYQGHYGLRICGAENITVKNIIFEKCVSDGIETQYNVSLSMHNKHIRIDSVVCDHNGRQGLSIEDGDDIIVTNSIFKNTGNPIGTDPKCGIDVEPYYSDAVIYDCLIENCIFEDNTNGDVQLHLGVGLHKNVVLNNLNCNGNIIVSSLSTNEEVRINNSTFTQFSLGTTNGSVYIDNCNFTNIYSSKVSKLFVSNCNIVYLNNSVYQAVLYFDVTYNENQLVQIVNSYIETHVGAYLNSKTKVNFINCYIKVIGSSVSDNSAIHGDMIGCTLDITAKAINLNAISNSDLTIKNSSISLHNTGASYSGQWAPIRFMSKGNYRIIDSRIIVDEDSGTMKLFHIYYTVVLPIYLYIEQSSINKYKRNIEEVGGLIITYKDGFSIIENSKQLYHIGDGWVDAIGTTIAFDVKYNITNGYMISKSANIGESCTCRLQTNSGYSRPDNVNIVMGSTTLVANTDYTYYKDTGWITILGIGGSGGVTDKVVITAECVADS